MTDDPNALVQTATWTVAWLPNPMGDPVVEVIDHCHRWQVVDDCLLVWSIVDPSVPQNDAQEHMLLFPLGAVRRFDCHDDADVMAGHVSRQVAEVSPLRREEDPPPTDESGRAWGGATGWQPTREGDRQDG